MVISDTESGGLAYQDAQLFQLANGHSALRLRVAESTKDRALVADVVKRRHYLGRWPARPRTLILSYLADLAGIAPIAGEAAPDFSQGWDAASMTPDQRTPEFKAPAPGPQSLPGDVRTIVPRSILSKQQLADLGMVEP